MEINFVQNIQCRNIVLVINEDYQQSDIFKKYDQELSGSLTKIIDTKKFEAKFGQSLVIHLANNNYDTVMLLGSTAKDDAHMMSEKLGSKLLSAMRCNKIKSACVIAEEYHSKIAFGAMLKEYSFTKYKSAEKLKNHFIVEKINFVSEKHEANIVEFEEYKNKTSN